MVVREDLPKGVLAAHVLHAAGESGPAPSGSIAVALGVPDEATLLIVAARLEAAGIQHVLIRENAGVFNDQATAIGVSPVTDRTAIRRCTSALRLVK